MGGVGGVGGAWRLRLVEWVPRSVERVDAGADRSVRAVELHLRAKHSLCKPRPTTVRPELRLAGLTTAPADAWGSS